MPFNGSGTFSIVNTFVPNTTILSAAVNANFSDIATGLSDCLTRDGQAGMTAAFKAISGSVGAPSITFTSDPATGLYLISAGNLGLTASGVLQVTVSTAGIAVVNNASIGAVESALANTVLNTAAATTASNINTLATSGTGAVTVGSTTSWATSGYLLCNKEIMQYAVASAAGITINTRGQFGTTAVAHATASSVVPLYAGTGFNDTLLPSRATAGRPSSPAPGDFAYNTVAAQPEYYNGISWVGLAPNQLTPQGYITTDNSNPIINIDALSVTSIGYTPFVGNLLPVPTNGVFTVQIFSQATINLSASQTTANIYDIYGFISSTNSTLTFGISPSWAAGTSGSVVPGSCARGTGAGGTALTSLNGLFVNATTMTILNGASSYSIATASGVYLGSIFIGATAGTLNCHRSYGQSRQWGIWNAYNRVPVYLKAGDSTATWTYATSTVRVSNNSTANSLYQFSGLIQETCSFDFVQSNNVSTPGTGIGIGVNSVATSSGYAPTNQITASGIGLQASFQNVPNIGVNQVYCLEFTNGGAGSNTQRGTETNMLLTARWRA